MEGKSYVLKKPATDATRIGILYKSSLENVQNFRKEGSVRNHPETFLDTIAFTKICAELAKETKTPKPKKNKIKKEYV